jgi:hypothetical protein
MPKWFNTAGPCQADIHYMLPSLDRFPKLLLGYWPTLRTIASLPIPAIEPRYETC